MKKAKLLSLLLALAMLLSLAACGAAPTETPAATEAPTEAPVEATEAPAESAEITVTDLIGREITVTPGSYQRVVCIGAGALRLYSYIGDVSLLCGVEDIDNETLSERPKMFDSVARPYVLAHSDMFASLPSCGVGGPNAQSPEAEKILTCEPDIVISLYGDADKANALQEQLGVPVVTLMSGPDSVFDERFNESVRLLGTIFEESEKAETLIGFIAAERAGICVPERCRSGECGWCRSRLLSGSVYVPARTDGRRRADVAFGYIHPCASFAMSDLVLDVPNGTLR